MGQAVTSKQRGVYRFFVDDEEYESTEQIITGEQLRHMAGLDFHVRIFLGEHHPGDLTVHNPDNIIHNAAKVDLAQLGGKKFYTLEPPTMDIY